MSGKRSASKSAVKKSKSPAEGKMKKKEESSRVFFNL